MPSRVMIPTLTTARLVLEPLGAAHSPGMFALWSQAAVCLYAGPAVDAAGALIPLPAVTPADSDRILDFFVRRAAIGLGFRWAMLDRTHGRFLGAVGFNHLSPVAELAYHLHPEAWGQGLMSEAAAAALSWLRATAPGREVEAHIDPQNAGSIRLAESLGFRATGEGDVYQRVEHPAR